VYALKMIMEMKKKMEMTKSIKMCIGIENENETDVHWN
jgi:hypothetical protein